MREVEKSGNHMVFTLLFLVVLCFGWLSMIAIKYGGILK